MELAGKFGALQEDLTDEEIEFAELKKERVEVKEGRCEECGAFDVLSRMDETFVCPACLRMFGKTKKNLKKR